MVEEFNGLKMLGDLTIARTYAKTKKDGTKENWEEISDRYLNFMIDHYPNIAEPISEYGKLIKQKKMVPSMRLLQFSDVARVNNIRAYNCAYMHMDSYDSFRELPWLLACGCGVGVGVMRRFVNKLPDVPEGFSDHILIEDTKEGWAYSFESLLKNPQSTFDYSLIRPAGSPLVSSGGVASGPAPLIKAHNMIRDILKEAVGRKLRPIEVLDIVCLQSESIVAGGSRRSAIISLFDADDEEMIKAKTGSWFDTHRHRGMSNNSAVLFREDDNVKELFDNIMAHATNGWGEPGIIWHYGKSDEVTNEEFQGLNPCAEITIGNMGLCNLTEVIANNCESTLDFAQAAVAATFFGTLQAGLTNFPFLRKEWAENAKKDALLGVSITGQAQVNYLTPDVLRITANWAKETNSATASLIGIFPARRITTTKPSGSTSAALGSTSGVHAAHSNYFIRRIRANEESPLGKYLINEYGITEEGFIRRDVYNDKDIVLAIPCKMESAITRDEGAIGLLERMKVLKTYWVNTGHLSGQETHNVSLTVTYKPEEKDEMIKWMWDNRLIYRGIAIMPYTGEYPLAPFEEIDERSYIRLAGAFPEINVEEIKYHDSSRMQVAACSGGSCEVSF